MATSYANNGGTGERRPEIVVTSNFHSANSDLGADVTYTPEQLMVMVDGLTSFTLGNGNPGREFRNEADGQDREIRFDFGVNASIVIDEFKIYINGTHNFGTTWTIEGSNNGSAWTTLKSTFNITTNGTNSYTFSFSNSTGYRYYRLHTQGVGSSFGGGTGVWSEFEFKIEDITPQGDRCSWYNTNGKGNRGAGITISTTVTLGSGVIANGIDGDYTNNSSHALAFNAGQSSKEIKFDFGSGAEGQIVIDTLVIWTGVTPLATNSQGSWKLAGSDDDSSYTDLESTALLFDTITNNYLITKRTVANTTGYRYYKLIQTSGSTGATPSITEFEFRISGTPGGGGGGGVTQPVVIICTGG